ncbi:MAG: riboflavin biosynthesis protein RibF [Magnetococcales bacterium]|nr:riboflavin biosynthesis protein RibF [Magnetococcales bacterium]
MEIIRGLHNLHPRQRGAVAAIGNFDGIHLGHQDLFRGVKELAARQGAPAMAITFDPHPRHVLDPASSPSRITGLRGKARWMAHYGIDAMFLLHFDHHLAAMEAADFAGEYLVGHLGLAGLVVGFNFRFGARGAGDIALLREVGRRNGFPVWEHPPFFHQGDPVSSTRVRETVLSGDLLQAEALLGRPFEIEGKVGHGAGRGGRLGCPTANLSLAGFLHPPRGVYISEAWVDGVWYPAVSNIGCNPTFGGEHPRLETHILAEVGVLYSRGIRIRFCKWLRDERPFPDARALLTQIEHDIATARTWFEHHPVGGGDSL